MRHDATQAGRPSLGFPMMFVLVAVSAGCTTHPIAGLLDYYAPGRVSKNEVQPYGGVCIPQGPIQPPPPLPAPITLQPPAPPQAVVPPPAPLPGSAPLPAPPGTVPPPPAFPTR